MNRLVAFSGMLIGGSPLYVIHGVVSNRFRAACVFADSAMFLLLQEKRTGTLKDQVAAIGPQLEELRRRKEDRARQFLEVKTEIAKICEEIAGNYGEVYISEEKDLTLRRLDEYHGQLATLQKEKVGNWTPLN